MTRLWNLDLINFLTFYLGVMFLLSLYLRMNQYRAILGLVQSAGRWPRLLKLCSQFRHIFLTWSTFLPMILALALMAINFIASRVFWPNVHLAAHHLFEYWATLFIILPLGVSMVGYDIYVTFLQVGEVDQTMMEGYFDQAETWLGGRVITSMANPLSRLVRLVSPWAAPMVTIVTLGWVNPRQMVAAEVRTALLQASELLNSSLWQVSVQVGLRFSFGLALWLAYAFIPA